MPDFSKLYQKPVGEARRPPTMPGMTAPGIIRQYELVESREKKTPGVKYYISLTGWGPQAPEAWSEIDEEGKKWDYTRQDVDLGRRQFEYSFWFPVDATSGEPTDMGMFMFEQFLKTTNISWEGMSYEQIFPSLVGSPVNVELVQQLNPASNRIYTTVNKISGLK